MEVNLNITFFIFQVQFDKVKINNTCHNIYIYIYFLEGCIFFNLFSLIINKTVYKRNYYFRIPLL